MDPFALDAGTAERLVTGAADVGDAPPGYQDVARTLEALRTVPESWELADEPAAVARIGAAVVVRQRPRPMRRVRRARRSARRAPRAAVAAAVVVASAVFVTGGFASAGSLPAPAQDAASAVLGKVGISVPTGNDGPANVENPPAATDNAPAPSGASDPAGPASVSPAPPGAASPTPGVDAAPGEGGKTDTRGNGQGELHGKQHRGTSGANANGQDNGNPSTGSPSQGQGNGNNDR